VPSKPFDLLTEARQFADTLSQLLNTTVCNGVRLSAVTTPKGDALVGHRLTKTKPDAAQGVPTPEIMHLPWAVVFDGMSTVRSNPCATYQDSKRQRAGPHLSRLESSANGTLRRPQRRHSSHRFLVSGSNTLCH
jgi:hypothetical protein